MLDQKAKTLLCVSEVRNFTKAAEILSLTQPAVSHHIMQLEEEFGCTLFVRKKGELILTKEGKIAVKYAKRFTSMHDNMIKEIEDSKKNVSCIRIGVTHTAESNLIIESLAKFSSLNDNITITIITDTINNLYDKLENYEIDMAIVEGKVNNRNFSSLMLDTDYLVCVVPVNSKLSGKSMITLSELKKENLILRLPSSATRTLFEATLNSIGESIDNFNVSIEVDNIATIKDLVRKEFGVSILAKSACMDELKKNKIAVLPIENLSMLRETNIVYHKSFSHMNVLDKIAKIYTESAKLYTP